MSIRDLKQEVSKRNPKPMGVKVGIDLWKELNSEDEIEEIVFLTVRHARQYCSIARPERLNYCSLAGFQSSAF